MIKAFYKFIYGEASARYVDPYDRMNPDERLFDLLKEYSEIGYGRKPYGLSTAEAAYIVKRINKGSNVF